MAGLQALSATSAALQRWLSVRHALFRTYALLAGRATESACSAASALFSCRTRGCQKDTLCQLLQPDLNPQLSAQLAPHHFFELTMRPHGTIATQFLSLELIRRSQHTIVKEKHFPWREKQSVLMWTLQYHAAVVFPFGIKYEITSHHRYTTFILRVN